MIVSIALGSDLLQRTQIPEIASAAGIVVGRSTITDIENQIGKGLKHTGGHPNGAREWYDVGSHCLIDADGFFYSPHGEVIDTVSVRWMAEKNRPTGVPRVRVGSTFLGILSKLKQGMSIPQIERALGVKLKGGSIKAAGLIKYSRQLGNKENDRFTRWEITFVTAPKTGLQSVLIHGD